MSSLFKSKKPKVEKPKVENQLLAAYAAAEKLRKRAGYQSTMLTGALGVQGEAATTKTQLGQ